jgi:hypothetical protein
LTQIHVTLKPHYFSFLKYLKMGVGEGPLRSDLKIKSAGNNWISKKSSPAALFPMIAESEK